MKNRNVKIPDDAYSINFNGKLEQIITNKNGIWRVTFYYSPTKKQVFYKAEKEKSTNYDEQNKINDDNSKCNAKCFCNCTFSSNSKSQNN